MLRDTRTANCALIPTLDLRSRCLTDRALSCGQQRLRGRSSTGGRCQKATNLDWNALLDVSCSALLGGNPTFDRSGVDSALGPVLNALGAAVGAKVGVDPRQLRDPIAELPKRWMA